MRSQKTTGRPTATASGDVAQKDKATLPDAARMTAAIAAASGRPLTAYVDP